jgi:hypothetical protein
MFRRTDRTRLDRVLAAIEIPTLGLWLGALCGFAFIFAPAAFHIVSDLTQFAALTSANLRALANVGYVCGAIAIITAIVRSREAADRTNDIARAACVAIALGFLAWEMAIVVPAMAATPDFQSEAYRALHAASTRVYGGAVLFIVAALVLAAVRNDS